MNPPATPPIADYASAPPARERLSVYDFVCQAAAGWLLLGMFAVPMMFIQRMRRVFDDFKLILPPITKHLIQLHELAVESYAVHWIWVVPLFVPLMIVRMPREVRARLMPLFFLLALLTSILSTAAIALPFLDLIDGVTGGGK